MRHVHPGDFAVDARLARTTLLAAGAGALAALAARLLLELIHLFTNLFFFQSFSLADRSPAQHTLGAWVIVVPAVGGLVVGLMARFGSDKIRGHGIPEAIEAILFGQSRMSARVAVLKPLSSGIVIGSGGPFGAEGPIIMTGGAIGSLIAQHFSMSAAERKALLVAGACAGMTAVFGTPVAAVLLAVELLLFELRPRSLLPVAIACAVAGFLRPLVVASGPLFPMQTPEVAPTALPLFVVAGLCAGALSAGLTLALYRMEDAFAKLPVHWMWWPMLGGLVVGLGGWLQPRALGVGYDVIGDLLASRIALDAALALLAVKAGIWVVALASGTSGGVLAPLLMMGAGLGLVLGHVAPGHDAALWPLVCMAATLGGTMRAPLMATLFAFGLTHDANALLPLLAATASAHGFTVLTMKRSILTEKIARRGRHIFREYGVDPLERHFAGDVMTRELATVDARLAPAEVVARYFGADQRHRAFPVVADGRLVGMIDRATATAWAAAPRAPTVGGHFAGAAPHALAGENCRAVAARLARSQLERLPVVADEDSMRLIGLVARSDMVKLAATLAEEEDRRERLRPLPWQARRRATTSSITK